MCFKHVNQLTVYFHIIHIPLQKAFTVFSKYSVFDHPNSYLANYVTNDIFNLKNSLHITIPINSSFLWNNCCCSTICLRAGGMFSFSWRGGKKAATTCEKRALTNIEAVRKEPLFSLFSSHSTHGFTPHSAARHTKPPSFARACLNFVNHGVLAGLKKLISL